MNGLLAPEGKITTILCTIGDLIILNLLVLLCSIPVVTFGAAFASMYQVVIKIVRKEEGHVATMYLRAFRQNLKNGTLIWLAGGGLSLFISFDIFLLYRMELSFSFAYRILLLVLGLFILMFTFFALVTNAYFENTWRNTMINGMKFCVIHIVQSILLFALTAAPFALLSLTFRAFVPVVLLGFAGPSYLCSLYFSDLFRKYETDRA